MDARRNTISSSRNLESFRDSIIFSPKGNICAGTRTDFFTPGDETLRRGLVFSVGEMIPGSRTGSLSCCLEQMNHVWLPWMVRQKSQEEAVPCFLAVLKPQTSFFGYSTNVLHVFPNTFISFTITNKKTVLGSLTVSIFLSPAGHVGIISVYVYDTKLEGK